MSQIYEDIILKTLEKAKENWDERYLVYPEEISTYLEEINYSLVVFVPQFKISKDFVKKIFEYNNVLWGYNTIHIFKIDQVINEKMTLYRCHLHRDCFFLDSEYGDHHFINREVATYLLKE